MMQRVANLLVLLLAVTFSSESYATKMPANISYTAKDLMNTACAVGCRKEGFDSGFYIQKGFCEELTILKIYYNKKQCACLTILDFNDVTGKSNPLGFNLSNYGNSSNEEPASIPAPEYHYTPSYLPSFSSLLK